MIKSKKKQFSAFSPNTKHRCIHGNLLEKKNKGLLILGAPGSGKSHLSTLLVQNGFRLISDDLVVLDLMKSNLRGAAAKSLHQQCLLTPISHAITLESNATSQCDALSYTQVSSLAISGKIISHVRMFNKTSYDQIEFIESFMNFI